MGYLLIIQGSIALLSLFVFRSCVRIRARRSLPPGPKSLPIVGNIMHLPPKGVPEFQHWLEHKDTYGSISSITVLGQTLVIIHDKQAAHDLLEKQSTVTSARPNFEFACKMCGLDNFIAMQQYNENFRQRRRFVHRQLGTRSAFNDVQEVEARRFLLRVLNEPESLIKHFHTQTAAVNLKMVYGYSIQPNEEVDPLVELVERLVTNIVNTLVPLAWAVDLIPALKNLPDSFPGMKFKQTAREWRSMAQAVVDIPYSFVRQQMEVGNHQPSFVSELVQQCNNGDQEGSKLSCEDEDTIKWTAATLYAAGPEASVSSMSFLTLAMVMFPEIQRKAQAEIDSVTGTDRLPGSQDREKLPYMEAVIKEMYRWSPTGPMGVAHVSEEDITYNGYFIPKGAYLLPAVWWFCHDPNVYKDPTSFDPERYLEPRNEPDPRSVTFGFGRRVCPGRFFADSNIFITMSQTLAAFNILKAVDEQGLEIDAKLEPTPGVASHPKEFPYRIVPRSAKYTDLIRSIEVEQPWKEGDASLLDGTNVFLMRKSK